MPYLVFLGGSLKKLCSYLESMSSKFSKCKFLRKNKNSLNLRLKCLIWVFLGENVKKTFVIFEITTLEFVKYQSFIQNKIKLST